MKLFLFCLINLVSTTVFSQEIEVKKFDKFDSIFTVVTKDRPIGAIGMNKSLDSLSEMLLKNNNVDSLFKTKNFQNLIQNEDLLKEISKPNIFIKIGKLILVKNKKPFKEIYTAYTIITAPEAISFDKETKIKVIFFDNSIKEYNNEASYKVWGKDDFATMYFTVEKNDPLFSKPIKAVKLQTNDYSISVDTDDKTKDIVIKMYQFIKDEKISYD